MNDNESYKLYQKYKKQLQLPKKFAMLLMPELSITLNNKGDIEPAFYDSGCISDILLKIDKSKEFKEFKKNFKKILSELSEDDRLDFLFFITEQGMLNMIDCYPENIDIKKIKS